MGSSEAVDRRERARIVQTDGPRRLRKKRTSRPQNVSDRLVAEMHRAASAHGKCRRPSRCFRNLMGSMLLLRSSHPVRMSVAQADVGWQSERLLMRSCPIDHRNISWPQAKNDA